MDILYWLLAFLIFSVLIFLHECGHYITARLFGVHVIEFSIGMGPKILTYTSKKTGIKYSLGMFLFGGYVSMAGEDGESDDPNALQKKAAWKRFIIIAAGAVMNLLTGLVLMTVLVFISGPLASNRVAAFPDSEFYETVGAPSSESYGLQVGDEIVSVNGTPVHISYDMSYEILHQGGTPVSLTVIRNGQKKTLSVQFPTQSEQGVVYGIPDFYVERDEMNVGNVIKHTWYRTVGTVKMVWESIFDLIGGKYGAEAVSGPIGVADAMSSAAQDSMPQLLLLVAVISINLGVANLLPLPALDGGRLVFVLFEMIFRRRIPEKWEGWVHFIGMILLLVLMVLITCKDFITLIFK